ncbi:MAG TPA: type IV secretion system protein VirB3 [Acetobacteraceae bacterium]|nr:type IV secretion system protein VirB3 [Acetobacteraceae bacterium]
MRPAPEPLEAEPLHVADTRPALMFGIPMELAVIFGSAFFAIDTELHTPFWGFAVLPFWFLAAVLVRTDYNGVRVFFVWLRTSAVTFDSYLWGGASVAPFPARLREQREMADAI